MKNYWLSIEETKLSTETKTTTPKMPPAEQEFADSLLRIAAKYGKLSDNDRKRNMGRLCFQKGQ